MKKIIILTILCIFCNVELKSQGFDWQLSPRMPEKYSDLFFGVYASYAFSNETGKFNYYEDECNCGKFENGTGSNLSFGAVSEYWLEDGQTALKAGAKFSMHSPEFSANQSLPIILNNGTEALIHYRNTFKSDIQLLSLNAGVKRRLFESFFFASLDLQFIFLLDNTEKHYEEITGPSYAPPFPTNPPSYKRLVSEGKIEDMNSLVIRPELSLGYDLDIGIGYYISPQLSISYNLTNIIDKGNWKSLQYGIGVNIMRWLK